MFTEDCTAELDSGQVKLGSFNSAQHIEDIA